MDPDRPYFADAIAWDRHRTSKGSKWMLDWLPTSPGLPLVGLPPDAPTFDASCRQSYAAAQLTCSPSVLDVVPNNTLHFDAKFVDADAANTLVTSHFDCLMAISPCFAGKPILCPHSQYIFKNPPACSFYSLARGVLHGPFAHSFADAIDWDRHRTSKGSRRMLDWLPTSPGLPPVGLPPDAPTLGFLQSFTVCRSAAGLPLLGIGRCYQHAASSSPLACSLSVPGARSLFLTCSWSCYCCIFPRPCPA